MDGPPETWRPIPALPLLGVPAGYEASSEGRVRSVLRRLRDGRMAGGKLLAQWRDKDGYWTVKLGRRNVAVHVAVALAFHGRPEVRHLNGDQDDTKPENLAWGSHWENEQDKKKGKEGKGREVIGKGSRPSPVVTSPVTAITP